jgi:hypothetical protein
LEPSWKPVFKAADNCKRKLDHKIDYDTKYHQKVDARQLGGKEHQPVKPMPAAIIFSDHSVHEFNISSFLINGRQQASLKTT